MPSVMRSFRLPEELNERVDAAVGEGSFACWARAAFEAYLDGASAGRQAGGSQIQHPADRAEAFRRANALLAAKKRA